MTLPHHIRNELTRSLQASNCSGRVFDAVVRIKEPAPQPMIDKRPTKMHPNSVDRFFEEHVSEYEARGSREDPTAHVDRHNAAYPKMHDELDRRRSAARPKVPTTFNARRPTTDFKFLDPKCRYCRKIIAEMKKKNSKFSTSDRNRAKTHTRQTPHSIKMQRNRVKPFKLSKIYIDRGCQYFLKDAKYQDLFLNEADSVTRRLGAELKCTNKKRSKTNAGENQHDSRTTVASNPESSRGSMRSSYHSMSLDQEPMVSS